MQPTSELEKEHENIRRMLEVVREMIRRLEAGDSAEAGGTVEADDVQAAIDFIREYADRSHHAKEEDLLFPAMGEAGFPSEGGPVAVMLDEHDEGRAYVTSMEEGLQQYREGEEAGASIMAEGAKGYVGLLDQHIKKENQALYPMADNALSETTQADLRKKFDRLNDDPDYAANVRRHEQALQRLEEKYAAGS